jgi:hypothetical protein
MIFFVIQYTLLNDKTACTYSAVILNSDFANNVSFKLSFFMMTYSILRLCPQQHLLSHDSSSVICIS